MNDKPFFTNPLAPAIYVYEPKLSNSGFCEAHDFAVRYFGVTENHKDGPCGKAYAIPTHDSKGKLLSVSELKWHVEAFLGYARQNKELFFQVNRIGCGENAYKDEQIAQLFFKAPPNVWLPGKWRLILGTLDRARLIVYGPSDIPDADFMEHELVKKTKSWDGKFELVTEHTSVMGKKAERWMRTLELPTTPFVPDTAKFSQAAHEVVKHQMAWYSTHMIAFSDGKHEDTLAMVNIAKNYGLRISVINCTTTASSLEILT